MPIKLHSYTHCLLGGCLLSFQAKECISVTAHKIVVADQPRSKQAQMHEEVTCSSLFVIFSLLSVSTTKAGKTAMSSSSSCSSDGNSSLPDEGGSVSQVPQASVELAGYGSGVWPDSLTEWFVDGAGLQ